MVVIKQMKQIDKIFESDNQNLEIQAIKKAKSFSWFSEEYAQIIPHRQKYLNSQYPRIYYHHILPFTRIEYTS